MRKSIPSLVFLPAFLAGCTAIVGTAGMDPANIKTAEQARRTFGEPIASGFKDGSELAAAPDRPPPDGAPHEKHEVFRTRRKLAKKEYSNWVHLSIPTLGLSELYSFPMLLLAMSNDLIWGQDVCFRYDVDGKAKLVYVRAHELGLQKTETPHTPIGEIIAVPSVAEPRVPLGDRTD